MTWPTPPSSSPAGRAVSARPPYLSGYDAAKHGVRALSSTAARIAGLGAAGVGVGLAGWRRARRS